MSVRLYNFCFVCLPICLSTCPPAFPALSLILTVAYLVCILTVAYLACILTGAYLACILTGAYLACILFGAYLACILTVAYLACILSAAYLPCILTGAYLVCQLACAKLSQSACIIRLRPGRGSLFSQNERKKQTWHRGCGYEYRRIFNTEGCHTKKEEKKEVEQQQQTRKQQWQRTEHFQHL